MLCERCDDNQDIGCMLIACIFWRRHIRCVHGLCACIAAVGCAPAPAPNVGCVAGLRARTCPKGGMRCGATRPAPAAGAEPPPQHPRPGTSSLDPEWMWEA